MELKVGRKVYLEPSGNKARYGNKDIQEYEIKKVGRKYFEVWRDSENYTTTKFYIESRRQVTDYTPDWILYFSKQEILDKQEYFKLLNEIREVIGAYHKPDLSLEQLRKIKEVISQ